MITKKLTVLLILLLTLHPVSAGVISLRTTVRTDVLTESSTKVNMELENLGDESAYDIRVSLITDTFKTDESSISELIPNEPLKIVLNATLTETIAKGKYPAFVLVDYTDANGYPFSSVSPTFIVYETQTASKVSGLIHEISLTSKESKKLTLSIRNLDDNEHDVDVKLILPREIKVDDREKTIKVGPKQEKSSEFEVSSLSAIPGSTYAVVASLEYEDKDLHYSSVANGIIRIDGGTVKKQVSEETSTLAYIVLFISIIFVLIYAYQKYIKRGKKFEWKKSR